MLQSDWSVACLVWSRFRGEFSAWPVWSGSEGNCLVGLFGLVQRGTGLVGLFGPRLVGLSGPWLTRLVLGWIERER